MSFVTLLPNCINLFQGGFTSRFTLFYWKWWGCWVPEQDKTNWQKNPEKSSSRDDPKVS